MRNLFTDPRVEHGVPDLVRSSEAPFFGVELRSDCNDVPLKIDSARSLRGTRVDCSKSITNLVLESKVVSDNTRLEHRQNWRLSVRPQNFSLRINLELQLPRLFLDLGLIHSTRLSIHRK